jgi:hypothetical protein
MIVQAHVEALQLLMNVMYVMAVVLLMVHVTVMEI